MFKRLVSFILLFLLFFSNFNHLFADEDLPILDSENQTPLESTESWTILESPTPPENTIPDIIITFQSASYLTDKDTIQDTYHCDLSKDECKVNFDLSDTFWWYVPAKFACINEFSFVTWEENKCNPTTIIFPYWNHSINFKIYEKDNPENYKEKIITIINEKEPSLEWETLTNTWNLSESGSLDINSWALDQDTSTWTISESWSIYSWSGSTTIEIPEVDIEIQSWLEFVDWNYKCTNTDCKVNLNLEKLFTGTYDIKNYICEWDFWSGTFTTLDTDKKCNPWYVDYGTGIFVISARISEKDNTENYKTWNLEFRNGFIDDSGDSEWQDSIGSWATEGTGSSLQNQDTNYGNNLDLIEIPNVDIEIQSWLELVNWIFKCKDKDCKVNLNLENLFTWSYDMSKYNCLWDFWSGSFLTLDTDKKCNPWYVSYSTWYFNIEAKVSEKDNLLNFKTWSLIFENLIISNKSSSTSRQWWWNNYVEIRKEIILQSGAEKNSDWEYICNDEVCKINVKYDKSSSESCLWDFTWWSYKEKSLYTCNPWLVSYLPWEYKIGLKISKNWWFYDDRTAIVKNNFIDKAKEFNIPPKAKILLQWIIWKDKELIWNKLICKNTKECSVNFDWRESTDGNKDNLEFYWDFWNGEIAEKSNPGTIKYSPWKYTVKLKVIDRFLEYSEDYFIVEVYEKEEEVIEINENIAKYIRIIEALPNPVWNEENEWIKIKNESVNFINVKWLEIDDLIWAGSKPYTIKEDLFLLPYWEKKLFKEVTKLNLNNTSDEVNLIYNDKIIDSLVWNYEVSEGFVIKKELKEKVIIIEVVDWDTVMIQYTDWKKEKLRLIWVDTPETKHPKKEVEKYWIEASNFTKDMLKWKEVELELDASNYRDKYNRLLGYIWTDDILFNRLLIEKWYWRAYLYFPFKYSEDFAKAEKNAKKNKLWIWSSEELKKEIQILEKIEKEQILENKKLIENLWFETIITNIWKVFDINNYKEIILNNKFYSYFSIWIDKKERLNDFDLLLNDLFINDKETSKLTSKKQEKIISYKTSKLKSGLKITWVTFPESLVVLSFDDMKYETISNKNWNYTFLIKDNLKVWEYKLQFLVSNWNENFNYLVSRSLILSKDYIFWVQDYMVKEANKKLKPKKVKKSKKKKLLTQDNITKKMKYDVKDIKKEEDKSSSSKNIIYIFLITFLISIMWFFVIKKLD